MSLLDYGARTIWRQPGLLLHQPPPTSKSRYLAILQALRRCPQLLRVAPMESLLMGLNDSARKKVTKRRLRWMRIVTCQWKHHQMRIRLTRLQEASTSRPEERVEGAERKERKAKGGKSFESGCFKVRYPMCSGVLTSISVTKSSGGRDRPTQFPTNPSQISR